jgi:hypothetical protein
VPPLRLERADHDEPDDFDDSDAPIPPNLRPARSRIAGRLLPVLLLVLLTLGVLALMYFRLPKFN